MRARSSASRRMCRPSLARRVTTRMTAFFGSFVTAAPRERRRAGRFGALRGFRLGMSAAIVLQIVLIARKNRDTPLVHLKVDATLGCWRKEAAISGRRLFGQRLGYRSSEVC